MKDPWNDRKFLTHRGIILNLDKLNAIVFKEPNDNNQKYEVDIVFDNYIHTMKFKNEKLQGLKYEDFVDYFHENDLSYFLWLEFEGEYDEDGVSVYKKIREKVIDIEQYRKEKDETEEDLELEEEDD